MSAWVIHPMVRVLTVVVEQLLNEVDVGQHHPSAAVSLERELVQSVALVEVGLQQTQVRLPLVPNHLPTGETSHRDNHGHKRECLGWNSIV